MRAALFPRLLGVEGEGDGDCDDDDDDDDTDESATFCCCVDLLVLFLGGVSTSSFLLSDTLEEAFLEVARLDVVALFVVAPEAESAVLAGVAVEPALAGEAVDSDLALPAERVIEVAEDVVFGIRFLNGTNGPIDPSSRIMNPTDDVWARGR